MKKRKKYITDILHRDSGRVQTLLIICFVVFITIVYPITYYSSSEIVTITVKDKERITTGSGERSKGKFLVYAVGEVFENTDSFIFWKMNSSDVQNELERGESYRIRVAGWRIPFFSSYRNIIEVEE